MNVAMPRGSFHGWGIAGDALTREIAQLPPLEGVTLHCIRGHDFVPAIPDAWGEVNVGYCFFEYPFLAYPFLRKPEWGWDHIVAGSTWCEEHLRLAGVSSVSTVLQGIDHDRFRCQPPRRPDGRFIVFSGGKFEFRKGQDLVIAAMARFMARHPDVWLSCAWHNPWPGSVQTMESSPFITWRYDPAGDFDGMIRHLLQREGIDTSRVILHPPLPNDRMASIYQDSDIGLFPNRCEGGNNMVMCEYMACGRSVIASSQTGHADVLDHQNAILLSRYTPRPVHIAGRLAAIWPEPDLDEIVEKLEEVYAARDSLASLGVMAAGAMKRLDWGDAARRFHAVGSDLLISRLPVEQLLVEVSQRADSGDTRGAQRLLEMAMVRHPADFRLLNAQATIDDRIGAYDQAVARYDQAVALAPPAESVEIRINLAHTLARRGDLPCAISQLEEILGEHPGSVRGLRSLAALYHQAGSADAELRCLERLVQAGEATPIEIHDFVSILQDRREFDTSLAIIEEGLKRWGDDPLLLNDRGLVLHELGEFASARHAFLRVHLLTPRDPSPCNNLGNLSRSLGNYSDAIQWYERGLQRDPGNPTIRFNRGLIHLLHGRFSEGWDDYECRFEKISPVIIPHTGLPRWEGGPLQGKRILVQSEQVYGDTFMFCRFLPLLVSLGGEVIFQCQDHLIRPALSSLEEGGVTLVVRGEGLPPADFQVPLLSLPRIFGTTIQSIPFRTGYLAPPKTPLARWEKVFEGVGRPRVGIVWGGRKAPLNADRSIPLSHLAPLFSCPGIHWVSFQLGPDRDQLSPFAGTLQDISPSLSDFGETAAALRQMDLLITIDTAIAHLSGALGVKTWLLLKHDADWRWFLDRNDSPWYSSLHLWRQKRPGCWDTIIPEIGKELAIFVSSFSG